jgi:NAD/NADP transhydrogenase alpha subunit
MALFGGVALIAPMLIMALHPGRTVDLVTTSVATVIFVIFIVVWNTDASGMDVLTSTAAYAAVLVVFVGANLAPAS